MKSPATARNRGFTLIEMMVVISIILILLGMAMPIYSHSVMRKREENLRQNLDTMNQLLFDYALDKKKPAKSLDDLVTAKYLTAIPEDITGATDTWVPESAEGVILSLDQSDSSDGIMGVHSGSNQVGSDGKPYSEW